MFTTYSLLTKDCNYVLDGTGKPSYKHVSHMWETTMSFSCSTLNSDNENFPAGITPPPNSRALCWWYGSRYLSWSFNAAVDGQFDFRDGSDGSHVFTCSFDFSKEQTRQGPRNISTDLWAGFIPDSDSLETSLHQSWSASLRWQVLLYIA